MVNLPWVSKLIHILHFRVITVVQLWSKWAHHASDETFGTWTSFNMNVANLSSLVVIFNILHFRSSCLLKSAFGTFQLRSLICKEIERVNVLLACSRWLQLINWVATCLVGFRLYNLIDTSCLTFEVICWLHQHILISS